MNKRRLIYLLIVAGSTLLTLSMHGNAIAASVSGKGITTSPVSESLTCSPGSSCTTQMMVEDNNSTPEQINLKVEKFKSDNVDGRPQIYAATAGDPSVGWVHFDKNNFIAQPNVWTQVTMTISLPKNASLGYYYAILFTPKTGVQANSNSGTVTTYKGSNAVLVLVDTGSSNEVKALKIASFTSARSVYQYLPATFNIKINNSGNIHLIPEGEIYISRSLNNPKTLASLNINSNGGAVLPNSERVFQASWSDGFPVYKLKTAHGSPVVTKNGKPEYTLSWNLNNSGGFRFGKYYAHLVMVYSNGSQDIPVQAVVSFWVIPWTLIIIALIILLIIGFGLWAIARSVLKSVKKSSKGSDDPQAPKNPKNRIPITRYKP
jgi:hypothetical protein